MMPSPPVGLIWGAILYFTDAITVTAAKQCGTLKLSFWIVTQIYTGSVFFCWVAFQSLGR